MTILLYRFRDSGIENVDGYQGMLEIPPDAFMDRTVDPNVPNITNARKAVIALDPQRGDFVQFDFEDFHALESQDSGLDSYVDRVDLIEMLWQNFHGIKKSLYGVPRLISGKVNQHMHRLGYIVDLCNVVNYRKCSPNGKIHDGGVLKSRNNFDYADSFNKPIIITVGAFMRDKNKVFHRMSQSQWTQTMQNMSGKGSSQILGWYCWSSAARYVNHNTQRLAETWTVQSMDEYLRAFMQHTKEYVAGMGGGG